MVLGCVWVIEFRCGRDFTASLWGWAIRRASDGSAPGRHRHGIGRGVPANHDLVHLGRTVRWEPRLIPAILWVHPPASLPPRARHFIRI